MQIFSNDILLNLEQIKKDYEHLCDLLTYEEILIDNKLCLKYQKQLENIEPIYKKYQTFLNLQQQLKQLYISADIVSEQEAELYKQEQQDLNLKITNLQKEILKLLDNQNAKLQKITIEVMSGSKNSTEQLKNDIVLGYQNFCKQNNLDFQIKNIEQNTIFDICGFNAKKFFNKESGLHVLSNKQSICKVFVYDSFDIIEPVFDEQDIRIEVCRSSGAGGQHINTTDSAIKITHLSTGITAVCQDERSQFQNKQKALENLKVKVFDFYKKQKSTFIENQKKEQVKLINKNYVVKIYDYNCKIIISKIDNKKITLDDFLSGHDL